MLDTFRSYAEKFLGNYWGTATVVLVILCSFLIWFLGKKDEPPITIIWSHRYVFLLLAILIFAYPFYRSIIAPVINRPPKDRFVILVLNFQPVSDDSKNAAKNFPDLLRDELKKIPDPTIEVIQSDETVQGDTTEEEKENARKIGLRKKANLVIFGSVRCNEGLEGCKGKYKFKPKILLTEGPIFKGLDINKDFICDRDYIDKSDYRDVAEIGQTVKFIIGLRKLTALDLKSSLKIFESIKNKDAEVYYFEALPLDLLGRYKEATTVLNEVIKREPSFAAPYSDKGSVLHTIGRYNEAIAACDKAIELDPKLVVAYMNKGAALDDLGKYEEAIQTYDLAIKLNPKDGGMLYYNKSNSLRKLGRYEESIAACDKAIEFDPKDAGAYDNKGAALNELGRFKEAIVAFDKAIELDPKFALAHCNRGTVLMNLGRNEDAIVECDKAIKIDPNDPRAYSLKFLILTKLGREDELRATFKKIRELDPGLSKLKSLVSPP